MPRNKTKSRKNRKRPQGGPLIFRMIQEENNDSIQEPAWMMNESDSDDDDDDDDGPDENEDGDLTLTPTTAEGGNSFSASYACQHWINRRGSSGVLAENDDGKLVNILSVGITKQDDIEEITTSTMPTRPPPTREAASSSGEAAGGGRRVIGVPKSVSEPIRSTSASSTDTPTYDNRKAKVMSPTSVHSLPSLSLGIETTASDITHESSEGGVLGGESSTTTTTTTLETFDSNIADRNIEEDSGKKERERYIHGNDGDGDNINDVGKDKNTTDHQEGNDTLKKAEKETPSTYFGYHKRLFRKLIDLPSDIYNRGNSNVVQDEQQDDAAPSSVDDEKTERMKKIEKIISRQYFWTSVAAVSFFTGVWLLIVSKGLQDEQAFLRRRRSRRL